MRGRVLLVGTLVAVTVAGCATTQRPASPLGRSIEADATPTASGPPPMPTGPTPPVGDPPPERGGTIPAAARAAQDHVDRGLLSRSPQSALRRYAIAYTNWSASQLPARERQLAAMSIGDARLAIEATIAARSTTRPAPRDPVTDTGSVVAIAPGSGTAVGWWVVVTDERTLGEGVYSGLTPAMHVTLAHVTHLPGGWAVSAWEPEP